MAETAAFEGWAVLELMGHRRLGGKVSEAQIAGVSFLRIDMPADEAGRPDLTQYYSPQSVYCLTPATEEIARAADRRARSAPMGQLAAAPTSVTAIGRDDLEDDDVYPF